MNIPSYIRYFLSGALLLALLTGPAPVWSQQLLSSQLPAPKEEIQLPQLGDSSSSLFSLQQEYQLGRAWLMSFRNQVKTVNDPLLQDYMEDLVYRLAAFSELKDRRLDIVIVENPTINAFAVPGGVMGFHDGLLLASDTEAQLASVISHELAHISQRHFARSVEAQKRNSIPNMAGLLAGIILAATQGGDAGIAAIAATQAASLQNQLRYSRLHETEADRAGMQTMVRSGMDPNAAAAMFEKMLASMRYAGNRPPEFLLSHPVTESRISDARSRARQYPRKMYTDSPQFQLMRARVKFNSSSNSKEALNRFRSSLADNSRHPEADQYGLALALTANNQFDEAQTILDQLRQEKPRELSFLIAQAELDMASGKLRESLALLENALSLVPGNHPLTMTYANVLLRANQAHKAEALLKEHVRKKPNDPNVWYLLAETHGLAGDIVGVHQARAEYFVLNGVLDKATKQLGYALPLVKSDHLTTQKIKGRIVQITQMKNALQNL